MIRLIAILVALMAGSSAFAQTTAAATLGGGLAEFMVLRLQSELPERWELAARGGLCLPEPRGLLLRAAQSLRQQPVPVSFVAPDEFARGARLGGAVVSPLYAVQIRNNVVVIDRWAASFWTEERTALDALTEGHFLRLGVAPDIREKLRSCVGASGVAKYVTASLKVYRQPTLGVLGTQQGQLVVTDASNAFAVPLTLNCAAEPFLGTQTLSLLARPAELRWTVIVRLNPDCALRMNGSGVVLTIDYRFLDGGYNDFMRGDPRVRLKFQNATSLIVR